MKYTITVPPVAVGKTIRRIPFSPNRQLHWASKMKWHHGWRDAVYYACLEKKVPKMKKCKATFIGYAVKLQDKDNFFGSLKGCVDGLKLLLPDDSNEYLDLQVEQKKVNRYNDEKLTLIIETL